jgi:hypothetical protein
LKIEYFFNIQKLLAQNAVIVSCPKLTTCKRPNSFPPQSDSKLKTLKIIGMILKVLPKEATSQAVTGKFYLTQNAAS